MLFELLVVDSIKYERKTGQVYIAFNVDAVMGIIGIGYEYASAFMLGVACLNLDMAVCGISRVCQYDGDDGKAFHITVLYYAVRIE